LAALWGTKVMARAASWAGGARGVVWRGDIGVCRDDDTSVWGRIVDAWITTACAASTAFICHHLCTLAGFILWLGAPRPP